MSIKLFFQTLAVFFPSCFVSEAVKRFKAGENLGDATVDHTPGRVPVQFPGLEQPFFQEESVALNYGSLSDSQFPVLMS